MWEKAIDLVLLGFVWFLAGVFTAVAFGALARAGRGESADD